MKNFNTYKIKSDDFDFICCDERLIIIKGIGKMFYQDGFPISMAIEHFKKKNIEVSIFHLIDELRRDADWSDKTILRKIKEDFGDIGETLDNSIKEFIDATYEDSREMIFKFLYKIDSNTAIELFKEKKINF